jgi:hypothetical protein
MSPRSLGPNPTDANYRKWYDLFNHPSYGS